MDPLVAGFWGVFFGASGLMLIGALLAYMRSRHKVPLRAAVVAALSSLFTAAYLGVLPIADRGVEQRMLAVIAAVSFALLGLLLLALLGLTREPQQRRRANLLVWGLAGLVTALASALSPRQGLALSSLAAVLVGVVALAITSRSAMRGDGLAWVATAGIFCVELALLGLSWIALSGERQWPLHALSALAGTAYLALFSAAMWTRYSYLIELREVMSHGPSYDPVTRMRSHAETGQLVGSVFRHAGGAPRAVGVVAVSIGNLYGLEQLHGRGSANHALFVCASRLRRGVPPDIEMGRLGDDGFLLLANDTHDTEQLVAIARKVALRLQQPVSLSISPDPAAPQSGRASWIADVGVGVLAAATPLMEPGKAVNLARDMSHTAWTFGSRIAWFDDGVQQICELPVDDRERA